MRKLASIQTVNAVEPIPNADAIEKIRVLGWWVVVKKGEHQPGDKLVYCEIDSLLPERPEFEFLRASSFKPAQTDATGEVILPAGFRIKTVRLRGQVSQGICFPLSILPPEATTDEGADVTDLLGVLKWEPPLPVGMGGKVKGLFPGFLPKTDETRVQVLEAVLERHRGKTFYVTEKLDGTSFTAFLRQGEFGICSRNLWMDETDESNVLVRVAMSASLGGKAAGRSRAARLRPGHSGGGDRAGHPEEQVRAVGGDASGVQRPERGRLSAPRSRADGDATGRYAASNQCRNSGHWCSITRSMSSWHSPRGPAPSTRRSSARGWCSVRTPRNTTRTSAGRLSFKVINPKFLLKYDE